MSDGSVGCGQDQYVDRCLRIQVLHTRRILQALLGVADRTGPSGPFAPGITRRRDTKQRRTHILGLAWKFIC